MLLAPYAGLVHSHRMSRWRRVFVILTEFPLTSSSELGMDEAISLVHDTSDGKGVFHVANRVHASDHAAVALLLRYRAYVEVMQASSTLMP